MTDGMGTNRAPHLSDEHLSGYVDGSPVVGGDDAGESGRIEAHIARCEHCRQRLRTLERARALIRTPVPPVAPAVRADAVSAVLRTWAVGGERDTGATPSERVDDGGLPSIEALRVRRQRPGFIGAAAAVAALLVVGVGVLVANVVPSSTSSTSNRAASAPPLTTVPALRNAPPGASPQPFATYGPAELGGTSAPLTRLGTVPSLGALRSTVNRVLSGLSSAAPAPSSALSQGGNGSNHSPATPSATGPATTVSGAPSGGASGGVTQDASLPSALQACLSPALGVTGGSRRIELAGSAVYRGTAALVYVFSPSTGASTSKGATVVVVGRHGCGVLASTTL